MRLDSTRPVADIDPLRRFLPQVMPSRQGAVLYFQLQVRTGPIRELLATRTDGTGLFHVVLAALLRTLVERPQLNRYVLGGRLMERDRLALTFSVKKGKRDDARIVSTKVVFRPTDTLDDVRVAVDAAVARSREPDVETTAEREMRLLNRLPRPLVRRVLRGWQRLERWGLLPDALTDDPMHTSAFVANLGSIGLDASFHHLSDLGTASVHVTVGRTQPAVVVGADGQPAVAEVLDLKISIDDRICDGFYCARSLARLEHWLSHPAALAEPWPVRQDLVPGRLWTRALATPEATACLTRSTADGRWYATTWSTLLEEVRAAGHALVAAGVAPGDRVAIQGGNRPEWTVAYLATLAVGAVACGLHEDLAPDGLAAALRRVTPKVVILESEGPAPVVAATCPDAAVVTFGERWAEFLARGRAADDGAVERRLAAIRPADPAVAVFTSGTTGEPRAAILTHDNVAWTAAQAGELLGITGDDLTVSYLPLSHVAEQTFTISVAVTTGGRVAYAPSRAGVLDAIREVRPTVVFGVPQIWSRVLRELDAGKSRAALGFDRVRYAIAGAARLAPELHAALGRYGIELLETYGQTEGCGPTTFTRPGESRPGSVGRPFPGVDVRIAPDGEVLVRGRNVFAGYLGERGPHLRDGWLPTGDLGRTDGPRLVISGRRKELLVTAGGENVAPGPLEAGLCALPLVDQAVVLGDGRPFVGALLALDTEAAVGWLRARGVGPVDDVHAHPAVLAELGRQVATFNAGQRAAEQIRGFRVLPRALSPEDGELTPTLKIRREVVADRWRALVDDLYGVPRLAAAPVRERAAVAGFRVGVASRDLDELFALRFRAFSEQGHLAAGAWPDGRMIDRFDASATHLALHDDDARLAGTARLVPWSPAGLPVTDLFDFDPVDAPPERTAEVGRLAVAAAWRGRRAPLVALVRGALDHAREAGCTRVYAFVPARAIRMYAALGLTVWELPTRPPPPEMVARRARMAPYFATQDPRVVVFTGAA